MKKLNQVLCLIALVSSANAQAKVDVPGIGSVNILTPFQLQRTDGKMITFGPTSHEADLSPLPPSLNHDKTYCDPLPNKNVDLFLRQMNLFTKLVDVATPIMFKRGQVLTPAQIKVVQSVPRCAPFLHFLGAIANSISTVAPTEYSSIDSMKFVSGFRTAQLEFAVTDVINHDKGAVRFNVSGLKEFGATKIPATATGIGVGVTIEDLGDGEARPPNTSEGDSPCTAYEYVRCCDRNGCRQELVSGPGWKHWVYIPSYVPHNWRITFTDAGDNALAVLDAGSTYVEDAGHDEACIPDYNHPDWQRRRN